MVVLSALLLSFCGLVFISGGTECIVVEFIWARFHQWWYRLHCCSFSGLIFISGGTECVIIVFLWAGFH